MFDINLAKYHTVLEKNYIRKLGRVSQVVGLTIESTGPDVNIGQTCQIKAGKYGKPVLAEVVGFKSNNILLMPLDDMAGVGPGNVVEAQERPITVRVSEKLLGRVLDGLGRPMDGKPELDEGIEFNVTNPAPNPLDRTRIEHPLTLGVKAIDGLLTIGKGQRVGIFAGSGVGKSTLMGMIARNTKADINVISLVGERGREVREFIEKDLGEEGLARSILVIATSDKPALVRLKCAEVATSIAEYFRSQGKDVMLLMDSLTRYAMAQREVGLAIGEPPVSRGYTPSVFAKIPHLLERAGNDAHGSITGLYTVLVDGDDITEPVTDTARSVLDGHIMLSRKIANRNHYPAIDVLGSVSRCMSDIVDKEHKANANNIKKSMAVYANSEDLINIGAYVKGSSEEIDEAITKHPPINDFLTQSTDEKFDFHESLQIMSEILT
ncbi:MAG: flagellar protein export ATPase FliI [Defluviitaleaceae bacterium]|nr:flagellar protein export ATPase FliI [Defluviitaleaceae bacterium]MCL2275306.1 flagellar protein export ATPase FliI [Defluviitaleaceae bacterium]